MLVLSRKVGEKIMVGDNITIVVNRVSGNRISLGIDAPANVRIVRGELSKTASEPQEDTAQSAPPVVPVPTFDFSGSEILHRVRY